MSLSQYLHILCVFFFFNDTATTEIYTLSLHDALPIWAIIRVGEPLGNFYGYVWDGIFQDSASAARSGQDGARVGGDRLRDLNGDGVVDSNDRTILGNAQPRWLFGLTSFATYKSLSVSCVVRGALDFQVVNLNRMGMRRRAAVPTCSRRSWIYGPRPTPPTRWPGLASGPTP